MTERNINKAVFSIDDSDAYTGPDRRHFQRRINTDRRATIRFELDKEPRRKGAGRRAEEVAWATRSAV